MKQIIMIDTNTDVGKSITQLLATLSDKNRSILFLTDKEVQQKEDIVLKAMIDKGLKSGKANKEKFFSYLGIK